MLACDVKVCSFLIQVAKCSYGVLLMTVYWVTGVIPVGITALLPMVIFPILGLVKAGDLSRHYFKVSAPSVKVKSL